jgi:hypothetical protein
MAECPAVKPGDWIKVGNLDCVVAVVRQPELVAALGDLEVVFDPKMPTNHDVEWNGEAWVFCKRPDFGGYADRHSRLSGAVSILRAGPFRRT